MSDTAQLTRMIVAGTIINDFDGIPAYRVLSDIRVGASPMAQSFEAIGDHPAPRSGETVPPYVMWFIDRAKVQDMTPAKKLIVETDIETLVALVMTLTNGSGNPSTVRLFAERIKAAAATDQGTK